MINNYVIFSNLLGKVILEKEMLIIPRIGEYVVIKDEIHVVETVSYLLEEKYQDYGSIISIQIEYISETAK